MRRTMILTLIFVVVAALAAPAMAQKDGKKGKKKPRFIEMVVEVDYSGPHAGVMTPVRSAGWCGNGTDVSPCLYVVPPFPTAKYLKVEVEDQSGLSAGGWLSQGDTNGDGFYDSFGHFCGAHSEPVEIGSGTIEIALMEGICRDSSGPSVVTSGKIKLTFSNLP